MRKPKSNRPRDIGFIGLGRMGSGMALNLLNAGCGLQVLAHRRREPIDTLVRAGALEAASLTAMARSCAVVFLSLPSSDEVEAVMLGPDGLAEVGHPGLIVVDTSTSLPTSTRNIATALQEAGMAFVDAPVMRSQAEAQAGTLLSLVGATQDTFDVVSPLLATYSEQVIHFGPVGAGHSAKLINNIVTCGQAALLAEAMSAAVAQNVDVASMVKIMSAGAANSGTLQRMAPALVEGKLDAHAFPIASAHKDVQYFRTLADSQGLLTPVSDAIHQTYAQAVALGYGEQLMAALFAYQEQMNSVQLLNQPEPQRKVS